MREKRPICSKTESPTRYRITGRDAAGREVEEIIELSTEPISFDMDDWPSVSLGQPSIKLMSDADWSKGEIFLPEVKK